MAYFKAGAFHIFLTSILIFFRDEELKQTLIDLIHTADDLDILDFKEFCRHIDAPKQNWTKTKATTGKHIPVY